MVTRARHSVVRSLSILLHHFVNSGLYHILESRVKSFGALLGAPDSFISVLFGGLLGSMFSFLQFLASPIIGGLSDRFGRRPGIAMIQVFFCLVNSKFHILKKAYKLCSYFTTISVLLVTTFFIALSYVFW